MKRSVVLVPTALVACARLAAAQSPPPAPSAPAPAAASAASPAPGPPAAAAPAAPADRARIPPPRPALPRAPAEPRPWLTGWYAPSGVLLGLSLHGRDRSNGFVFGVEQSLVYQVGPRASWWGGVHAEAAHDLGAGWTRLSFGPELGLGVVGVDGGFVRALRSGEPDVWGVQGRLLLTIGVAAVYGRAGVLLGGEREGYGEAGLLLKWPWSLGLPPTRQPR